MLRSSLGNTVAAALFAGLCGAISAQLPLNLPPPLQGQSPFSEFRGIHVLVAPNVDLCKPEVSVNLWAASEADYNTGDSYLLLRVLTTVRRSAESGMCGRGFALERINFGMFAGDKALTPRYALASEAFMTYHAAGPVEPARNPSGQNLVTDGLNGERFYRDLFEGRFEGVRLNDVGGELFAGLYVNFLLVYGGTQAHLLTPPVIEVTRDFVTTSGDTVVRRINNTWVTEARFAESLKAMLAKLSNGDYVVSSGTNSDIQALFERNKGSDRALKQLAENMYRYAAGRPAVQAEAR